MLTLVAGAALTQLGFSGCDQNLRNTLLTGIEQSVIGLLATFTNAFFQSLMSNTQTSQPIVQAIFDHLPKLA